MVNLEKLCNDNHGLVYLVARRYLGACERSRAIDIDDLAQAGYIGLIEAAKTYNETKGKWTSWAGLYIRKEMSAVCGLRGEKVRPELGAASLDAPLSDGEDITLQDTLPSPGNMVADAEKRELVSVVRGCVEALPDKVQRDILKECDLGGKTLSQWEQEHENINAANARKRAYTVLRRDKHMRALKDAWLNSVTPWGLHVGVRSFNTTWESSTEALVWMRERWRGEQ